MLLYKTGDNSLYELKKRSNVALYVLMKELNYEVDYKKFKEDNQ